jgi:aspartate kinase
VPPATPVKPGIIVRKYGGSSLATVERICQVARDLAGLRADGHQLVVVVSAMGDTTDELTGLARQANPDPPRRELDMLLSVGERITMSLLSMALAAEGCPAVSYTGSQCAIITDTSHTDARIVEVKGDRVRESLAAGYVVVVAGFQGVSRTREITTLGRGGSDTTAVALAAALGAERCEILKDVDGVMTADPGLVPAAQRYDVLDYEELSDLAAAGCGVVHHRAVRYAQEHGVPLYVRSSFHDRPGTQIASDRPVRPLPRAEATYRPLGLVVQGDVAWLELCGGRAAWLPAWTETLAAHSTSEAIIAEWLEETAGIRWGAIGPSSRLALLRTAAEQLASEHGATLNWREGLTCFGLAGGRPESWTIARQQLAVLMQEFGIADWILRADGPTLRLLVPAASATSLAERLHAALWPD